MQNVEVFFKVLEKIEKLESKKNGNLIRNTSIFIFKSGLGYNVYFGISNDTPKDIPKIIQLGEQQFTNENFKKVFLPNTGIFLGTINEQELNYILFIFNKKYSVITGTFNNDKETVIRFHTHPEQHVHATINLSDDCIPNTIKEHIRGTKDNYFKLSTMKDKKRIETIKMNGIFSSQDYITMLNMIKYSEPENYLRKAYSYLYPEFMEYVTTRKNSFNPNIVGKEFQDFVKAEDFLKR